MLTYAYPYQGHTLRYQIHIEEERLFLNRDSLTDDGPTRLVPASAPYLNLWAFVFKFHQLKSCLEDLI